MIKESIVENLLKYDLKIKNSRFLEVLWRDHRISKRLNSITNLQCKKHIKNLVIECKASELESERGNPNTHGIQY